MTLFAYQIDHLFANLTKCHFSPPTHTWGFHFISVTLDKHFLNTTRLHKTIITLSFQTTNEGDLVVMGEETCDVKEIANTLFLLWWPQKLSISTNKCHSGFFFSNFTLFSTDFLAKCLSVYNAHILFDILWRVWINKEYELW